MIKSKEIVEREMTQLRFVMQTNETNRQLL